VFTDADPLIGTTVGGHYEIEALIGVGAMGRVYRAHHTRLLKKRYALKVLFGELTASPTMRMRFAHEAESASKLEHPNIVGVLDFGCTDAGLMYLVMDLVEGPTLGALIDQGAMQPPRVLAFARQLCAGLAHAHARGIVHRDFKPDNILVAGEPGHWTLRIADFGLAISIKDDNDDARLTASGVLCTPTYAAPEQLLGKDIDQRADLYALGVTMYEMLTGGVLPFARGSQEVMLWKVTTEWPAVSGRAPKAPPPLADLIKRLLVRDPEKRPASATEVIETLDRVAAIPERAVSLRMPVLRLPARRWPVLIGATAATVLLAALGVGHLAVGAQDDMPTTRAAAIAPAQASEEQVRSTYAPSTSREAEVPEPPPEEEAVPDSAVEAAPPPARSARQVAHAASPIRPKPAAVRAAAVTPQPAVANAEQVSVSSMWPQKDEPLRAATPPPPTSPAPVSVPAPAQVARPASSTVTAPVARVPLPPPPPRAPVPAAPVARAVPPRIIGIEVTGALAQSVVRRGVERALPSLKACMDEVGARVVSIGFAIEELRRATHVRVSGPGAQCIASALGTMRVDSAPDVGEVTVDLRLSFTDKP
jgi:serine/threonine-protein kinase